MCVARACACHAPSLPAEGGGVSDGALSFSVLMTAAPRISGGMKGATAAASTREAGASAGKAACARASLSTVSQKSSAWTSSEPDGHSGHVTCGEAKDKDKVRIRIRIRIR